MATYQFEFSNVDGRTETTGPLEFRGLDAAREHAAEIAVGLVIKRGDWLASGWSGWTLQIKDEQRSEVLCIRFLRPVGGAVRWFVQGPPWPTRVGPPAA